MLEKTQFNFIKGQGNYQLLPVEFYEDQIPFDVKRTYFIVAGDKETQTGQHAHFEEEEVFLILNGGAELISLDENGIEYSLVLNSGDAVYVPKMIWHGFKKIQAKTVISAFSSTHHKADRSDYFEDKEAFIARLQN